MSDTQRCKGTTHGGLGQCWKRTSLPSGFCPLHDPETRKAKTDAYADCLRAERIGRAVLDATAEAAIVDAIRATMPGDRPPPMDFPDAVRLSDAILAALRAIGDRT